MLMYRRLFEEKPDRLTDFARLARVLTGTAVGLVLGGGGAKCDFYLTSHVNHISVTLIRWL